MNDLITVRIFHPKPRKICQEILDELLKGFQHQPNGERFEFAEYVDNSRLIFLSNDCLKIQRVLHFGAKNGLKTEVYFGYGDFFEVEYSDSAVNSGILRT